MKKVEGKIAVVTGGSRGIYDWSEPQPEWWTLHDVKVVFMRDVYLSGIGKKGSH